jgi:dTDP-4-dehydrorhamnose reductase
MRVLLTGANGFVGAYLARDILQKGWLLLATGSGDCRLSFTGLPNFRYERMELTDTAAIEKVCDHFKPDIIIHSGALSRPDECEKNQELAFATNVVSTQTLLGAAEKWKSFFLFLSSDFVFDGQQAPYKEADKPGPVNYYGLTKLAAEKAVIHYRYDWSVVRTILVYGRPILPRRYLLSIVEEKLRKGETYSLVNDQQRAATYVEDLVKGILNILDKRSIGIFHLSGKQVLTPYEMGIKLAKQLQLDSSLLLPVTASVFKEPARRPAYTSFILDKAKEQLGYEPRSFDEGLALSFD